MNALLVKTFRTIIHALCLGIVVAGAATAEPLTPERSKIVPLIDAHQHMMSPTAMGVVVLHPSLPAIDLPPALGALLRAREKVTQPVPFEDVFTADAIMMEAEEARWWKGADKVRKALDGVPPDLRLVAKAYAVDGSVGSISGNAFTAGSKEETANFQLAIRKDKTGRWRITSEMLTPINPPAYAPPILAERIIDVLDDAGIKYGVVLSLGYWFGQPQREIEDRYKKTRDENDWTVAQVARYPERLIAFCGVNPIADYAIAELERCARMPAVRGMKMHVRNSRIDLSNPEHVAKLKAFFRAANANRLAIVAHIRGNAETLLDIFAEAPDITIQVAHMASDWETLGVFADAMAKSKPGARNLYFDWTQALPMDPADRTPEMVEQAVSLMRKIGMDRIFFGSDMPLASNPSPRDWWRKTILTLPLSDDELRNIADNLPPYMQPRSK